MTEENNFGNREKKEILKYCPNCGVELNWTKNLKFCINCGSYLIPHINRDNIEEWLGINLSEDEIENLYKKRSIYPAYYNNEEFYQKYYTKKLWDFKASFGVPIVAFLGKLFLILAIIILLIIIGALNINNLLNLATDLTFWLNMIDLSTQVVFILIAYAFVGRYVKPDTLKEKKWELLGIPLNKRNEINFLKEIIIGFIVAFIMFGLVILVQLISAYLTSVIWKIPMDSLLENDSSTTDLLKPTSIFALVILILLQYISIAPAEEILFRGFAQSGFIRSWGNKAGILVTALYFASFHIFIYILDPPLFFFLLLPYLAISLVLGYLVYKRGNLYASIIAHATYNSIQFIILFLL